MASWARSTAGDLRAKYQPEVEAPPANVRVEVAKLMESIPIDYRPGPRAALLQLFAMNARKTLILARVASTSDGERDGWMAAAKCEARREALGEADALDMLSGMLLAGELKGNADETEVEARVLRARLTMLRLGE